MTGSATLAQAMLDALAARDFPTLSGCLAPAVRMRALLPGGLRELAGPEAVVGQFRHWFEGADPFDAEAATVVTVGSRSSLHYRFALRRPGRPEREVIEQYAYVDGTDAVEVVDLVCSGFLPLPEPSVTVHHFDAGDMGCSDGLAQEFRRQVRALPAGDVLVVVARDPAAKEDLPPLARLMGHAVQSIEARPDGGLTITVEVRQ